MDIDPSWSEEQIAAFIELAKTACNRIAQRVSIPANENQSWEVLPGAHMRTRGQPEILTAPVVQLGRAIIALVDGTLPDPPADTRWFYGQPGDPSTIGMSRAP